MHALRLYGRFVWISLKAQMQYKVSLCMLAAADAANTALEFLAIFAFFRRFGGLEEWTIYEVGLFYGMTNMAFALCEAAMRGYLTFRNMIREAGFDRLLVRPRSTVLQVMGNFQFTRAGRFAVGLAALVWAIRGLALPWDFRQWLLLLASILGGAAIFAGVMFIQATSCFWTVESVELFNTMTYGGVEACQYPVSIYDEWLKNFFCYVVPLAAINYWPCAALLGRDYAPALLAWLSPLIGPLFCCVGLAFWRFGVKHYRSTGS